MKQSLNRFFIAGFLFTSIAGTLGHFMYDWSGQNIIIGLFTPINESIWEHIKLLFFPMLLFTIFAVIRYNKQYLRLGVSLLWSILFGSLLIPMLYYTYTQALGIHISAIDISIYYISVLASFLLGYFFLNKCSAPQSLFMPRLLTLLLCAAFIIFTIIPPALPIFAAP